MDFLLTLFGAVVGGAISLATTYEMQRRMDVKTRRGHAISLLFRVVEACDELRKIHKHLVESLTENGVVVVPHDRYYERVLELLGTSDVPLSYRPEELAILAKKEHDDIVNGIFEIIRGRNIAVSMVAKYNELKHQLDNNLVELGQFEIADGSIHLNAHFDPQENKDVMGRIYKANILIGSLYSMTSEIVERIDDICPKLNEALPSYFPKGTDLRKVTLSQQA